MNQMKKMYFFIFLILISINIFAQNELILDIKIDGNYNIDKDLIRSALTFDVGEYLDPEKVSKSINNLYQLGLFNNVSMEKESISNGIKIIIKIEEYPIVEEVEYTNNRKVGDRRLDEIINLRKGSYWSPFLKVETDKKISAEYKKKGYNLATTEYEATELENNRVNILVKIDEGKKVSIKKIRINGNKEIPSKKLLRKMKTKKASLLRSGKFEKEKFEEDLNIIVAYYNKKGYIDARILSHEIKTLDDSSLEIDIFLVEGNQYTFGNVEVSGNERFTDEIIKSKFKFKENEVFDQERFNKQLREISSLYYEDGYIYSTFDQELRKRGQIVDLYLTINENTRAKIHKIFITGNRKTKEKVIRRQLAIAPGDYFRQSRVIQSQQNIYNMGFFEPDLAPDYKPINQNGDIDLTLKLTDKTSGSANGGVGYNSQDHWIGQLSVSQNNLFGNAWRGSLKWEFGGSTQNYEFDFTNPYFYDTSILVGFNLYHTKKEWNSFNYQIFTNGGGVRFGKQLNFLNFSKFVAGYSLYMKQYDILDHDEEDISTNLAELDSLGWRYTSTANLTFSRDSRDNVYYPTTGSQFTLYSELAGGHLRGDFDYFKQIAQVNWYTKLFWQFVLRSKWRFGYVTAYGDTKEVPPDERFYLGGTGPDGIRGYADRSIGPDDGGLREIIFSSEFTWPISKDMITGLLFYDAGDSYDKLEDFHFWNLKSGGGTGIRIRSPFGLIGFDYAYNFQKRKWEPHFQFGTTF